MPRERIFEDLDLLKALNKGESISDFARRYRVSPAAVSKRVKLLREEGVLPEKQPTTAEEWTHYWLEKFESEALRKVINQSTELKAALAELKRLKDKLNTASSRLDEIEIQLEEQKNLVSGGDSPGAIAAIARLKAERDAIEEAVVALGSKINHQEMIVQGLQERLRDALSPAMTEVKAEGIIKARHLYECLKALRDGFQKAQAAFAGRVRTEFEIPASLRLLSSNDKGVFSEKYLEPLHRFFAEVDRRQKEAERLRIREQEEKKKLAEATKDLGFEPPLCRHHETPVVMKDCGLKEMPNFTVRRVFRCPEPLCSNRVTILDEEATKRLQESAPPLCNNHYDGVPRKMKLHFAKHAMREDGRIYKVYRCPECGKEKLIYDPDKTARWWAGKKGGEENGYRRNARVL